MDGEMERVGMERRGMERASLREGRDGGESQVEVIYVLHTCRWEEKGRCDVASVAW